MAECGVRLRVGPADRLLREGGGGAREAVRAQSGRAAPGVAEGPRPPAPRPRHRRRRLAMHRPTTSPISLLVATAILFVQVQAAAASWRSVLCGVAGLGCLDSELVAAVQAGDVASVSQLLRSGEASPNAIDEVSELYQHIFIVPSRNTQTSTYMLLHGD